MKPLQFSFIIPVFNRPQEIKELLESFLGLDGNYDYEIVIVEDGSTETSEALIKDFSKQLQISYYYKVNTGPGDSRNYGMKKAKGNYFIILDSDVLLPSNYLTVVSAFLHCSFYDCYGGPDAAHPSFSNLQKAISYVMTSFITTGGVRGNKYKIGDFQPRSFNMGLSKNVYIATKGFSHIHPGEDPDLSLRLKAMGFKSVLIPKAVVFHKRRVCWVTFFIQVYKFGLVRPILNKWHPKSKSIVFWFPLFFSLGLLGSFILGFIGFYLLLYLYIIYFALAFLVALLKFKSIIIALYTPIAILIQFFGYAYGFGKSNIYISFLNKQPKTVFPFLFYK